MQNRCYSLVILFTLAQLLVLLVFGYTPYPDSEGYIFLARECMEHGEPYPVSSLLCQYPFLWNIGAVNIVAMSLTLTGSVLPVLLLYSLLKGLTAWLCYDLTLRLSGKPRLALFALVLYMLYPANYGESTSVLTEVPFICCALMAVWLCVAKRWFVAAGMLLAVGNWFRPFAIVFIAALLVAYLFQWRRYLQLTGGYILTLFIIGSLTYARTGLFLYQAKTGWMALMQYSWDNSADHTAFPVNPETIGTDSTLNVAQKDAAWRDMFFQWLPDNKGEYVRQMPAKLVNTYASDNVNLCTFLPDKAQRSYLYEELSINTLRADFPRLTAVQWLAIVNLLYYYLLLLTAMLSLLYFRRQTHLLPLAVIIMGTLMLLLVGHGEARFHQPFMPFVIMLSACFFNRRL